MTRLKLAWLGAFASFGLGVAPALSFENDPVTATAPTPTTMPSTRAAEETVSLREGWLLQDDEVVATTGDVVSRRTYDTSGWHRAVVPGTVLTSLVADGTYPDPLYGLNNTAIPDTLSAKNWWYRRVIVGPPADGRKRWLRFDGINYTAELWLNGRPLATVRGAFSRGEFDVSSDLKPNEPNVLAVLVRPQPHAGKPHQKSLVRGVGKNGGITGTDGATFLSSIGWDWIPTIRDRDTGIWQDVTLATTGPVLIKDPFVHTRLPLPRTDSADLSIAATLVNATDAPQTGTLTGLLDGRPAFDRKVTLAPREQSTVVVRPADAPALHVDRPALWWPNGYGEPALHRLTLQFDADAGGASDRSDTQFGIRDIRYAMPGSDNLALVVNGVPVVAKGGNWGMDEALKRVPPERLDAMVRMHRQANYTMIRNWVGQSTGEDFYRACDKYGLLVWDEMFQPSPADGPDPLDPDLYLLNVKEKILRFRNHPSIALWCGRNEGNPPPQISRGIDAIIRQYDDSRLYQASSTDGRGVNSGGPYFWRSPREYYNVDAPFKTEIGSVSIPTFEAVTAMLPEHSRGVIDDVWAERDFAAGAQRGDFFPHQIAARYGDFSTLADFVRKGQLATYESYRAMYEGRFAKLFKPVTGVLTWMSNPAQPSFVWQLYSHDLEPNAALFATRQACEPVHVQLNQSNGHLVVVNNRPAADERMTLTARVVNSDGSTKYTVRRQVDAAASAATDVGELTELSGPGLSAVHFVVLELADNAGRTVSRNFYWRGVDDDHLAALDTLPDVPVRITTELSQNAGTSTVTATITNTGPTVALMTHLQLRRASDGSRVLPVFYEDNYVSLLPSESRRIAIKADAAVIGAGGLRLAVDGWNVAVAAGSGGPDVNVELNATAMARGLPPAGTRPVDSPDAIRINCGGPRTTPVAFGKPIAAPGVFERDTFGGFFDDGVEWADAGPVITDSNAAPEKVYQTGRRGSMRFDVPARLGRTYTVTLHFVEPVGSTSPRSFSVKFDDRPVLQNFDIAAEAGRGRALVKTFRGVVPARDGHISIALRPGDAGEPIISGIEVVPEAKPPTTATTFPATTRYADPAVSPQE